MRALQSKNENVSIGHYWPLYIFDTLTFYRLRQKNSDGKTDQQRAEEYMQVGPIHQILRIVHSFDSKNESKTDSSNQTLILNPSKKWILN